MADESIKKSIQERADEYYQLCFDIDERKKIERAYKGDEKAIQELTEEIYGFTHWATYHEMEQKEYHLELAGGGPAARLVVKTDLRGVVEEADFQFQDWFEPWTSAQDQDHDILIKYAQLVGFYEE